MASSCHQVGFEVRLTTIIFFLLVTRALQALSILYITYYTCTDIISMGLTDISTDMTNSCIGWKDMYSNNQRYPCEADGVHCMQPLLPAITPLFCTAAAQGARADQEQVHTFLSRSRQLERCFAPWQCHSCSSNMMSWQQGSPSSGSGKQPRRCRSSVKYANPAEHCASHTVFLRAN